MLRLAEVASLSAPSNFPAAPAHARTQHSSSYGLVRT